MATKKAKTAEETTETKTAEETTETKTAEEQKESTTEKEIADIKSMLEQLAAQNEELRKENEALKSRTNEQSSVREDNNKQKAIDRMKELVPITLFKDNGKYKDDLVVQLAGVAYQIKRGVQVMIPRAVYDIVIRSQQQDQKTANMLDSLQSEYAEKNK